MNCKICHIAQLFRTAKEGGLTRREFMRRAGLMGLAFSPATVGMAATSSLDTVHPKDYFPRSNMPKAVRERLANRLLGRQRITDPAFDDYYAAAAKSLSPEDDFLIVTAAPLEVNAFAHYGGLLVMMRGMWEFADNEDGLLGIVAHEMGHVKLNHFESKRKLNETISVISVPLLIAGLIAGSQEVREGIIVGGSGIITGQIYGHSRELEHEADVVGLQLLVASKRDGRQVASLLGRLSGNTNEYISTHPAPLRRAAYINDRLLGLPQFEHEDSLEFLLLREKLDTAGSVSYSLIKNKQRDINTATGRKKVALQFGVMLAADSTGNVQLANMMEEILSTHQHPFIVAARADYISRKGDIRRALAMLTTARTQNAGSAALALTQAIVMRRAGEHRQLLALHKGLPQSLKMRADILREVSLSASELKENAEANLLLTQSHIQRGEFEQAQRQIEIAERFKMDTKKLSFANKLKNDIKHEIMAMTASQQ
ncbi:MAG: M48 family metalloprotease [Gammaproteobacteria bacterium WSBS_2016_MAG_OTU1]